MNLYNSIILDAPPETGLETSGWQKIANIIDAIRELKIIFDQSWYAGCAMDSGDLDPFILEYNNTMTVLHKVTMLEPHQWTPAVFAFTIETLDRFKQLINLTLESSIRESTVFTSRVDLARRLYPVLKTLVRSFEEMYQESLNNFLGIEDHNARENTLPAEHKDIHFATQEYLHELSMQLNHLSELHSQHNQQGTALSLFPSHLQKLLRTSALLFKLSGSSLIKELK